MYEVVSKIFFSYNEKKTIKIAVVTARKVWSSVLSVAENNVEVNIG